MKNILTQLMDLLWLGGPIFSKELIISSKRRRNYFIRFAYPALLGTFLVYVWINVYHLGSSSSTIYQISQMARVGNYVSTAIIWFQFIVVQVLAVSMLSTAIGGEIYHKTLGVLMTTPISSFQIVMGKLLSRLFQLLLIIAISLPVLSIIRVLGGVQWNYILSGICITITASIFAGSLSLYFSIYNRQSHLVISRTLLICFLIYAGPLIAYAILQSLNYTFFSNLIVELHLFFINPFLQMLKASSSRIPVLPIMLISWQFHCLIMLGLSAAVILWSSICVRKVGLRQITGQAGLFLTRKERKIADKKLRDSYNETKVSGKIRDIKWHPVIWREIANPLIKQNRIATIFSIILSLIFLVIAYGLCIYHEVLGNKVTHTVFILVYFFIVLIRTTTFASTSITSEKETRSWPILLTSPLSEKEIAYGKIFGSCIRAWPYWLILITHIVVFSLVGIISLYVFIPLMLVMLSSVLLVSASGVMFSSICKRSSTSSAMNTIAFLAFTLPITICCCVPTYIGSPLLAVFSVLNIGGIENLFGNIGNPSGIFSQDTFYLLFFSHFSFVIFTLVYFSIAYAFYVIAISQLRRRIL
jgi:ABC-type transport system involved in multi-copper enzyme maturation permease subunit